jgi:hypothetical protein
VAQEEDFGRRSGLLELSGFVGEDFAGETVFARDLEGVGVLLLGRVERKGEDGFTGGSGLGGEG